MRWTAALRPAAAALLVAAANLTGGATVAALWPVSVETDYYAADVRLSPSWGEHSTIGSDTVVGSLSAQFTGVAPGIRVEPRIKPEITDLVESGNLRVSTLAVSAAERQRIIQEVVTGIGLRFVGGAALGLVLVLGGSALYRRGLPQGKALLGGVLVTAITCGGVGVATLRSYTPERLQALHSTGLLEIAVDNRGLFGDVRTRTDQAAPYLRNLLALSNAVQAEYAPGKISEDSALQVLLVSDIHSANQYALMRTIVQEQGIDVVIDSGDLINFGQVVEARLTNLYQGISSLDVPYVFVRGNHDTTSADDTALVDRLAEVENVVLLEPKPGEYQQVSVGGLRIAGFNDPRTFGNPASEEMAEREREARDAWVEVLGDGQVPDLTIAHNPKSLEDAPGRLLVNGHMHVPEIDGKRIQVGTFTGAGNLRRFTWNTDGELLGQPNSFDVLTFDAECQAERLTRYEYRAVIEGQPSFDSLSVINAGRLAEPAQEGRTCGGDAVEVEPLSAP